MGDFYAIALHHDQLRAGLVALHHRNRQHEPAFARTLRSAFAAALRALAAVVDAPRPTPAPERPLGVAN